MTISQSQSCIIFRCTWFYKGDNDQWYVPYQEDLADKLEVRYSILVCKHLVGN